MVTGIADIIFRCRSLSIPSFGERVVFQFRFWLSTNAKKPKNPWKVLVINYSKKTLALLFLPSPTSSCITITHACDSNWYYLYKYLFDFFDEMKTKRRKWEAAQQTEFLFHALFLYTFRRIVDQKSRKIIIICAQVLVCSNGKKKISHQKVFVSLRIRSFGFNIFFCMWELLFGGEKYQNVEVSIFFYYMLKK